MIKKNSQIFRTRKPKENRINNSKIEEDGFYKSELQIKNQLKKKQYIYENSTYSFYSSTFLKKIAAKSQNNYQFLRKHSLYKILSNLIRSLMLNELEIVFLSYFIQQSQWNIHNFIIESNIKSLKIDYPNYQEPQNEQQYKKLFLYLNLIGYTIKYYLNGNDQAQIYNYMISQYITDFSKIFQLWANKYGNQLFIIQPIKLNKQFNLLVSKPTETPETSDYNQMVEQLLLISPAYKMLENFDQNKFKIDINKITQKQIVEKVDPPKVQKPTKKITLNYNEKPVVNRHITSIFENLPDDKSIKSNREKQKLRTEKEVSKKSSQISLSQDRYPSYLNLEFSELSILKGFRKRKSDRSSGLNPFRSNLFQN